MNNFQFINEIENFGYKARLVNLKILDVLKNDIEIQYRTGAINKSLYKRYLSFFEYKVPKNLAGAKSIITIAVPRPQIQSSFEINGKKIFVLIPPTYTDYNKIPASIINSFSKIFIENNFQFIKTRLPEKSLAVRSGLAFYGRNNITYIPGLGSFYQLVSFYTTIDAEVNNPIEPRMLERCNNCVACINVCPTNAISKHRFLIQAEKCLTFLNENLGEFPNWLDKNSHNSLVGCILCQKYCPEDKNVRNWIEYKNSFSEDETKLIVQVDSCNQLPAETVNKLNELDLLDTHIEFKSLQRNLISIIEKECNQQTYCNEINCC